MKAVKNSIKKLFRLISQADVVPLDDLVYVGSTLYGYHVPDNYLNSSSICYCIGAGVDISLDVELVTRFGPQVFIFDPMPYAFEHFNELIDRTKRNEQLITGKGEYTYTYKVSNEDLDAIKFINIGVWNEKKIIRFYSPAQEDYAGHSITNLQNTDHYIEAPVDTLSNIMQEQGHQYIDLLKIEIEGSEYTVIDNIIKDKIDVKIILVEFDEFHHRKGKNIRTLRRIKQSTDKLLKAGYKLVHSVSYYKRTFVRNDVFDALKNRQQSTSPG